MEFADWVILALALIVSGVGALLVAAWAIVRTNIEDDWP